CGKGLAGSATGRQTETLPKKGAPRQVGGEAGITKGFGWQTITGWHPGGHLAGARQHVFHNILPKPCQYQRGILHKPRPRVLASAIGHRPHRLAKLGRLLRARPVPSRIGVIAGMGVVMTEDTFEKKCAEADAKQAAKTGNQKASVEIGPPAQLLNDIHAFLGRFVIYPSKYAHDAHALWIAHTHLMGAWESTPRLALLSPEPASGKTRALEVSELLVPNPIEAITHSHPSSL